MLARRTLLQLTTRLAIGLGALFLVGVLLAAIPNHRAPVVAGAPAQTSQATQMAAPAAVPSAKMDEAKPQEKGAARGGAHWHATAPSADDSSR